MYTRNSRIFRLRAAALLVTLMLLVIVGLAAEILLRHFVKDPYQWDRRLMFFSQGRNFINTDWGGFSYQPNSTIHSQTYYITNLDGPELVKEYDYTFRSNSRGLVQLGDSLIPTPSILLLGDSYTEGQGAPPWFYQLESKWSRHSPYQLINGGLLGTGLESWGRLYRALASELHIARVVVVFISDDWTRDVLRFPSHTLDCLRLASRCRGDETFYGLPDDPNEAQTEIQRLARARVEVLRQPHRRSAVYQKLLLPVYHEMKALLRGHSNMYSEQIEVSNRVVLELIGTLGRDNLLFIHLPAKDEIDSGPSWIGKAADSFLLRNHVRLIDGFTACGLNTADYHRHDGHPNAGGYDKIRACVDHAMREAFETQLSLHRHLLDEPLHPIRPTAALTAATGAGAGPAAGPDDSTGATP